MMSAYITELKTQINGDPGQFSFFNNDKPVSPSSQICLIIDPFALSCNDKKIQSGIYSKIASDAVSEHFYLPINELICNITKTMSEMCIDEDAFLEYHAPSIHDLIKIGCPGVDEEYESILDRICSFLHMSYKYTKTELFVFINLRNYIDAKDYSTLLKQIIYHKYQVLFFESRAYPSVEFEKTIIIDDDLCEIRSNP